MGGRGGLARILIPSTNLVGLRPAAEQWITA